MLSTETIPPEYLGNVSCYLGWDNDRLDACWAELAHAVEAGAWLTATDAFQDYAVGLDRHIRMEEEVLFPMFEACTGQRSPTGVMRIEHEDIREELLLVEATVARRDAAEFELARDRFEDLLAPHNQHEEQVVYPITDRLLTPVERKRLVARLIDFL